jgi:glutathione peroxidase
MCRSAAVDRRRIIADMKNFYDFKLDGLDGQADLLAGLKGKVVLAVNVASQCALTPQYVDLQDMHGELADENFAVVGFPCNQFGSQEPGSAKEIRTFCSANYGISFPISAKLEVNGPGRHPLYAWLTDPANGHGGDIQWNFEKFLLAPGGQVVKRIRPRTEPDAPEVIAAIEEVLPR